MGQIIIAGLGPGDSSLITAGTWQALQEASAGRVLLRTAVHPSVAALTAYGLSFTSFDHLYEEKSDFAEVYESIVAEVFAAAQAVAPQPILYAVPGSPLVAEQTVRLLRSQAKAAGHQITVLPGMSFLEVMYAALEIDPVEGLTIMDAADLPALAAALPTSLLITQVYSQLVASEVKLALAEYYGDEYQVTLVRNLSLPDEEIQIMPLYELDRVPGINHLTSVYVPASQAENSELAAVDSCEEAAAVFSLEPLQTVMARLRSPGGCVWDLEQTHTSLRRYFVEEVYEVLEAIELADDKKICEELGDLLLQIVFHARIAEERQAFSLQEVIDTVTEKMVRRHPHVFAEITVQDAAEVLVNWEAIKAKEKGSKPQSVLAGVPPALPALMKACKLQGKAAKVGFDWDNIEPVWDKVQEELAELRAAVDNLSQQGAGKKEQLAVKAAVAEELGDVLFSLVNLARFLHVEPESALQDASYKFSQRFQYIEQKVKNNGWQWSQLTLRELDVIWAEAKKNLKHGSCAQKTFVRQEK